MQSAATYRPFAPAVRPRPAAPPPPAVPARPTLPLAGFWDDTGVDEALVAARRVLAHLGVALEPRTVPATLAKGGTVGRIGVPPQALRAAMPASRSAPRSRSIRSRRSRACGAGCSGAARSSPTSATA